jgi:hypothetical protein
LDIPREWWTKAAPFLRVTSALIKPFLGIGLAAVELDFTTEQWDAIKEQLALGKEALNAAADAASTVDASTDWGDSSDASTASSIFRAEGSVLRTLHYMLKEKDPTFGDLRRVMDTRGNFVWVHPRYLPIYQPNLPDIPLN